MSILSTQPCRPLTDREVAALVGALVGGIVSNGTDADAARRAVRWWAESDAAWEALAHNTKLVDQIGRIQIGRIRSGGNG